MSLGSCSSKGYFLFMSLFLCPHEVSPLVPPLPPAMVFCLPISPNVEGLKPLKS